MNTNEEKFVAWVNIKISERALVEQLDAMCSADERSRSDFLRRLVRQEWARRAAQTSAAPVTHLLSQKYQKTAVS